MSDACCHVPPPSSDVSYRRVLWIALFANAAMFFVESISGILARSRSLQADSLDFLGDTANYAISLLVA